MKHKPDHAKQNERNKRYIRKRNDAQRAAPPASARIQPENPNPGRPLHADDPAAWLRYYLAPAYPLAWGVVHLDIIAEFCYALASGGRVAIAAPRGTGKSTVIYGLALWALLTGRCKFPVVLPWSMREQKRALRFWVAELCYNARLHQDYVAAVDIFHRAGGISAKLANLTENGQSTGAALQVTDGTIVLPHDMGAIGAATVNGNPRGLNFKRRDGAVVRPTLVIIDDPQDRKTAQSAPRVSETVEKIRADVAGMAGPDSTMPIVMACTVIVRDDVADVFLRDPGWRAVRVPQVTTWPAGYEDPASETRARWDEWNGIRQRGASKQDSGAAPLEYYTTHKAAMTSGMAVSWSERYDRARGQPDAMYSAMWDYYDMGRAAFMSERQNAPELAVATAYDITARDVAARVDGGRRVYDARPWARIITLATDVNHYGLHSAALAFGNDHTSAVLWYGRYDNGGRGIVPKNTNETDRRRMIYEALVDHGRQIAAQRWTRNGTPAALGLWMIDGGYEHETVQRYVATHGRTVGVPVLVSRGYGFDKYKPYGKNVIGMAREFCHLTEWPQGQGIAYHADYWREIAQRAWLGSVGAPGSCSLFESPNGHTEFSEHVTRERLIEKLEGKAGVVWRWAVAPGWHDWGDAVYMCHVAAAWSGIGTAGAQPAKRRYVETRKAKFQGAET